jgi:hypothetical protein
MQVLSVPIIMVLVYIIVELLKNAFNNAERFLNFVPLIAAGMGLLLGIFGFLVSPEQIPTDNVFNAMIMGLFSGLSATGSNQIFKQLGKFKNSNNNNPPE